MTSYSELELIEISEKIKAKIKEHQEPQATAVEKDMKNKENVAKPQIVNSAKKF